MARVICPSCKKTGNIPDQFFGKRIKCPRCGEHFKAPSHPNLHAIIFRDDRRRDSLVDATVSDGLSLSGLAKGTGQPIHPTDLH